MSSHFASVANDIDHTRKRHNRFRSSVFFCGKFFWRQDSLRLQLGQTLDLGENILFPIAAGARRIPDLRRGRVRLRHRV